VAAIIECTIKEICYVSKNFKVVPEHGMRAYKGSRSTTSPFLSLGAKFKGAVKCTLQKNLPPPPHLRRKEHLLPLSKATTLSEVIRGKIML
jgi:hypothetical protein